MYAAVLCFPLDRAICPAQCVCGPRSLNPAAGSRLVRIFTGLFPPRPGPIIARITSSQRPSVLCPNHVTGQSIVCGCGRRCRQFTMVKRHNQSFALDCNLKLARQLQSSTRPMPRLSTILPCAQNLSLNVHKRRLKLFVTEQRGSRCPNVSI